ncbi:MAG: M23 family metallopeptidase [Sphingomicrobium sp.]
MAAARVPMFISSGFGRRADPIKDGVRMHDGIDLPGRLGTRVHATGSGVVSFAGWAHGYGNLVQIDHPGHLTTRYGHLSRILVARGTPVVQGAVIGEMGSTGRSTGSHLHYEVRADGVPLNPMQFVGAPSVTYEMTWAPQARVAPRWTGWGGAGDAGSLPVAEIR